MKSQRLRTFIMGAVGLAALAFASLADAQAAPTRLPNIRPLGFADATAASTFATASYADLPAATLSFIPARDPNQTCAPSEPCPIPRLHVFASLDVIKATATTGTCGIFVNGALLAKTARTIDTAAKQGTLSLVLDVPESVTYVGTPLVVKLQCKSGDTNVFTVNNGLLYVEEVF